MLFDELCSNCFAEIGEYPCPHCGYDPAHPKRPSGALPAGSVLRERFSIGRVLSVGACAITYAGIDLTDRSLLAVREFFPASMADRDSDGLTVLQLPSAKQTFLEGAGSFLREARTLRSLRAVGSLCAPTVDFLENRTVYAVFPFVNGPSLEEDVRRNGPYSFEKACRLFLPVLQALQACHTRDLLHLALNPKNLLLTQDRLTLINFASARYAVSGKPAEDLGSAYSPPELQKEPERVGPWTDVYGAAASIYFALTGLAPGPNPLPLCDCAVSLPLAASDLLQHVLTARSAEDRVSDMEMLIRGLEEAQSSPVPDGELFVWSFPERENAPVREEGEPFPAVPEAGDVPPDLPAEESAFSPNSSDPITRLHRRRRKRRTFLWIALLCLLAAAAAVGLTFFLPKPAALAGTSSSVGMLTLEHRWLGVRLEAPADYPYTETPDSLTLSLPEGETIRISYAASCGTALYGPGNVYDNPAAVLQAYGGQSGLSDIECSAPSWKDLPAENTVLLEGSCRIGGESAAFSLYAMETGNGPGCILIGVVRPGAEGKGLSSASAACVGSLERTGHSGINVRICESESLGIRFLYDGDLLKIAGDQPDVEVRLYLRSDPSQSICLSAPEPEPRTDQNEYIREHLLSVEQTLDNRLKKTESRFVRGNLGDWTGETFLYDFDGDFYSVQEDLYADRDGRLLQLSFSADSETAGAVRLAAELVMQSAEKIPSDGNSAQ